MLTIDKHKLKQKCINFGYLSTKFWLKGNDTIDILQKNIHSHCYSSPWAYLTILIA